jgi:D-amino-acid dehydrogenase
MKHTTDVLIIGAGAIGICSAYYLSRQGRRVTVVDQGDICSGSSYGNAGLIVPSYSIPLPAPGVITKALRWMINPESPFYIHPRLDPGLISWLWKFRAACSEERLRRSMPPLQALSMASSQLYDELGAIESIDFGYEKRGLLELYRTRKGFRAGVEDARLLTKSGIEVEILTPADIRNMVPELRINVFGGVYFPRDKHLIPYRFVRELAAHITETGVELMPFCEVIGIETVDRRIIGVQTTRGEIGADQVVLAGGAWSPAISRHLHVKLAIQPAKGYSVTFKRPPNSPATPLGLGEARAVVTPMGDTLRVAGTLELAGMDLSVNLRRVRAILRSVPKFLPDLDPDRMELIEIWRGLRPCTPDGLPYIGRPRAYDNLVIAAGHAMLGMSLAPMTGKLVSELTVQAEPSLDLTPFRIERF